MKELMLPPPRPIMSIFGWTLVSFFKAIDETAKGAESITATYSSRTKV